MVEKMEILNHFDNRRLVRRVDVKTGIIRNATKEEEERMQKSIQRIFEEITKKENYIKNVDCAETSLQNYFNSNLKLEGINEKYNNIIKDFKILLKILNKNKTKFSSNREMSYVLACRLNDIYIFFTNVLIKLSTQLIPEHNLFGKDKEDGSDSVSVLTILRKIKDKGYIKEEDLDLYLEIQTYFSIYAVIIRNFYSHGWINLFPFLTLKKETYNSITIKYKIINSEKLATNILVEFFDLTSFMKEYKEVLKSSNKEDNEIKKLINKNFKENFNLETQKESRNFLRRISLNVNIEKFNNKEYPKSILVFNEENKNKVLKYNEEEAMKYINMFFKIISKIS